MTGLQFLFYIYIYIYIYKKGKDDQVSHTCVYVCVCVCVCMYLYPIEIDVLETRWRYGSPGGAAREKDNSWRGKVDFVGQFTTPQIRYITRMAAP